MTKREQEKGRRTAAATDRDAPAGRVLGDLLHANPAAPRIPEQEWVDIVRAIAAGDQAALRAIYERSHRLAYTLIMRITHDCEAAEELTVDVYHDVWRRSGEYDPANGTVLGWIMNQARSRAIDRLRYEKRQKRVSPYPQEPLVEDSEAEENFDREQLAVRLRAAAGSLTRGESEAIEAAYFSDMTHAEIAAKFQLPLGTVKTRIRSALAKLRRQLGTGKEAP